MTLAEPLTADAFRPFGDVIAVGVTPGVSANQGSATRFDWCTELVNARPHAKVNVSVFRSVAKALPFEVKLVERHLHSSQAFIPMVCARLLVVVAPTLPSGGPDVAQLRAFVTRPGQGFNYRTGTWHHPMVALDADADLVMVAHEDRSAGDCEEHWLAESVRVAEPAAPR